MEILIWVMLYLFITSNINALIDYDIKVISNDLVQGIPFYASLVVLISGGLYGFVYLKNRKEIKESYDSLNYLLRKFDEPIDEKQIEIYNVYDKSRFKIQNPTIELMLKEIKKKIDDKEEAIL